MQIYPEYRPNAVLNGKFNTKKIIAWKGKTCKEKV